MFVTGKTTDGREMIGGALMFFDTYGYPMTTVFSVIRSSGCMVDWIDFWKDARKAGWSHDTILSRLSEAVADVWGKDFRDVVIGRLDRLCTLASDPVRARPQKRDVYVWPDGSETPMDAYRNILARCGPTRFIGDEMHEDDRITAIEGGGNGPV